MTHQQTHDERSVPHPYLPRPLREREQAHRRGILIGIGALIVLSTSPVFGHHLATRADAMLAGRDHLFRVCLIALHLLLEPVHLTFHVLLLAGIAYAVWDRARARMGLRRALGCVKVAAPVAGDRIEQAARRAGLPIGCIQVVDGLPNPAFTAGWWRPRIYVAAALPDAVSADELVAILAHESAHVSRRDPLRLSLLRFLACTLFYLPALRRLADDAADEAEIAADDDAVARIPDGRGPLVLASAILQVARQWGQSPAQADLSRAAAAGAVVGFQRVDQLERHVRRLMGEDAEVGTHVTRRSLALAGAALVAVWVSGLMMAHPLPPGMEADGGWFGGGAVSAAQETMLARNGAHGGAHDGSHGTHCDHHGAFALTHLFCLGMGSHASDAPCPHAVASVHSLTHAG